MSRDIDFMVVGMHPETHSVEAIYVEKGAELPFKIIQNVHCNNNNMGALCGPQFMYSGGNLRTLSVRAEYKIHDFEYAYVKTAKPYELVVYGSKIGEAVLPVTTGMGGRRGFKDNDKLLLNMKTREIIWNITDAKQMYLWNQQMCSRE